MTDHIDIGEDMRPITYIPKALDYIVSALPLLASGVDSIPVPDLMREYVPTIAPKKQGKSKRGFLARQVQQIKPFDAGGYDPPSELNRQTISSPECPVTPFLFADAERLAYWAMAMPQAVTMDATGFVPMIALPNADHLSRWKDENAKRIAPAMRLLGSITISDPYFKSPVRAFEVGEDGDKWTLGQGGWCPVFKKEYAKHPFRYTGGLFWQLPAHPKYALVGRFLGVAERVICASGGLVKASPRRKLIVPPMIHRRNKSEWLGFTTKEWARMVGVEWEGCITTQRIWRAVEAAIDYTDKFKTTVEFGSRKIGKESIVLIKASDGYSLLHHLNVQKRDLLRRLELGVFVNENRGRRWQF